MEIIKKQVNAYIALDSLIAMGLVVTLATLILAAFSHTQQELKRCRHQQEVLNSALMAMQTQQERLDINGCQIRLVSYQKEIQISDNNHRVLTLKKD